MTFYDLETQAPLALRRLRTVFAWSTLLRPRLLASTTLGTVLIGQGVQKLLYWDYRNLQSLMQYDLRCQA